MTDQILTRPALLLTLCTTLCVTALAPVTQAGVEPVIPGDPITIVPPLPLDNTVNAPTGTFTFVPPVNLPAGESTTTISGGSGTGGASTGGSASAPAGGLPDDAQAVTLPDELVLQDLPGSGFLTDAATSSVVQAFNDATAFCSNLPQREYVVDCFAYEYRRIADALPDTGDLGEVKKTIEAAADKLDRVVRRAPRSNSLPPARAARRSGPAPRVTARPLTPVATEAVPAVAEEAAQVIEETQTILIRSSENSEERRRQFQRISEAMDTGTILLRSL